MYGRMIAGSWAVAVVVFFSSGWVLGEPPVSNKDFMRQKLSSSQKLLEAIAVENYDAIAKHSQELSLLSLATNWQVFQTPAYVQHSSEFRRAADAIHDAAEKKNIDATALAYMDMTMKCVNCHKYVRGIRAASAPALEPPLRK